jgi:hypothetical protein
LYRNKPSVNFKLLETEALASFENIVKMFRIKPSHFVTGFNSETLNILFDQDVLTGSLIIENSDQKISFSYRVPSRNKAENVTLARKFIVNCAKIELWLLGYDIDIDGRDDFEISMKANCTRPFHSIISISRTVKNQKLKRWQKPFRRHCSRNSCGKQN